MATFSELIARANILVDDSYLADFLGDFINQGVYEIAGGMQSSLLDVIIPPLPELFTIDTVETDTADGFINMPSNFHRNLQLVSSSSGSEIDIADSFIEFTETYPLLNRVGNISEVIEHGRKLYYQGIPTTSETLTLHYYKIPITMIDDDDLPDGIPEHLQISLLVNFAAWKSYDFLEDGVEGETPNTIKYQNAFYNALKTLELTIPHYSRGLLLK